jgi:hypothetical protein
MQLDNRRRTQINADYEAGGGWFPCRDAPTGTVMRNAFPISHLRLSAFICGLNRIVTAGKNTGAMAPFHFRFVLPLASG